LSDFVCFHSLIVFFFTQFNLTLHQWLLDGVLFMAANPTDDSRRLTRADMREVLSLCKYCSRFVRFLFAFDLRDLDSVFNLRGQYERCP
jgi:hypothetical protein